MIEKEGETHKRGLGQELIDALLLLPSNITGASV